MKLEKEELEVGARMHGDAPVTADDFEGQT